MSRSLSLLFSGLERGDLDRHPGAPAPRRERAGPWALSGRAVTLGGLAPGSACQLQGRSPRSSPRQHHRGSVSKCMYIRVLSKFVWPGAEMVSRR